jgi:hypothetical protein
MQLQNVRGIFKKKKHEAIFIIISFFRGFGFITFKDANSVEKVLEKDVHTLDEKQVCISYTSV